MRILLAAALALLVAPIAAPFAMADVNTVCDGKYAQTAKVIDAAYARNGTLYSGGDGYWPGQRGFYFRRLDHVGPTINAYRIMYGLEPLQALQGRYYSIGTFDYDQFAPLDIDQQMSRVKKALTLMTEPIPNMSAQEMLMDAHVLDIATLSRPVSDWWLRLDEDFYDYPINVRYQTAGNGLKPLQRKIGELAKTEPAMDWLLANLATARPQHQWTFDKDTELHKDLGAVLTHIERKAQSGNGVNPYTALLPLSISTKRPVKMAKIKAGVKSVENCQASQADYANLAAAKTFLPDDFMPTKHLKNHLVEEAKYATLAPDFKFDEAYFDYLVSLDSRTSIKGAFVMPMLYSAKTKVQFDIALANTTSSRGLSYNVEPVSFLPVDSLETHAPATAFARYISLRRYEDARRVLDAAIAKNPKLRPPLEDILTADIPASAAMSLAALRMKCVSHNISNFCVADAERRRWDHTHRNIFHSRDSMGFQLSNWLACAGKHDKSLKGLSGLKSHGTFRVPQYAYGYRFMQHKAKPSCVGGRVSPEETPFDVALFSPDSAVNFENLKLYNGERRLSRALSQDIIEWAKTERKPRRFFSPKPSPHAELMAEGLYRVTYLNKHEGGGEIDGVPAGQRAFDLQHSRFAQTAWAAKTKYWFKAGWVH